MIKALVAAYGDRLIKGGITGMEATEWAGKATGNQVTSAIALFNDAHGIDASVGNPFAGMSKNRGRGRSDMPHTLTRGEVDRLQDVARRLYADGYGEVLAAMIEVAATSGPRTGELFALEHARRNHEKPVIWIEAAVKAGGKLGAPKYDQKREMPIAPAARALIDAMPTYHERFLFPTSTGCMMTQPTWTYYWHPLRDAFTAMLPANHWLVLRIARQGELRAAEPDRVKRRRISNGKLDVYELRHRAITYMGTPEPDGLGLTSPDIAVVVGHRDGGQLIEEVYMHRNEELARARVIAAFERAYEAESHNAHPSERGLGDAARVDTHKEDG
jgi:integrase